LIKKTVYLFISFNR